MIADDRALRHTHRCAVLAALAECPVRRLNQHALSERLRLPLEAVRDALHTLIAEGIADAPAPGWIALPALDATHPDTLAA